MLRMRVIDLGAHNVYSANHDYTPTLSYTLVYSALPKKHVH